MTGTPELSRDTVLLSIVGPTAVGKTAAAVRIAPALDAEIVSVDSMQVYRGMDIGTAKPSLKERQGVEFHMLDVIEPGCNFSAAAFKDMACRAISEISLRGRRPLLVGGSGLYFRAVVDDLQFSPGGPSGPEAELDGLTDLELHSLLASMDEDTAIRVPPSNRRRVIRAIHAYSAGMPMSRVQRSWTAYSSPYRLTVAGLTMPRDAMYRVIDDRVDRMIADGLLDEVKRLRAAGLEPGSTASSALGYRQIIDHLDGSCSLEESIRRIKVKTRNFAKRQLTWFRADPRIRWFDVQTDGADPAQVERAIALSAEDVLEYLRDSVEN